MKPRKCLDKCLAAHPSSPCDCSCGGACHARGECDREAHRYNGNGTGRVATSGPFRPMTTPGGTR